MDQGGVADAFGTATGQTANEVRAMIQGSTLTGRFITPQHVADLVVFLASDRSGNTTGSDHPIDGVSSPRYEPDHRSRPFRIVKIG